MNESQMSARARGGRDGVHQQAQVDVAVESLQRAQRTMQSAGPARMLSGLNGAPHPLPCSCRMDRPSRCRPHAPHSRAQQRPLAVQGASGVHTLLAGGAARHGVAASGVALAGGAGRDAHRPEQQSREGRGREGLSGSGGDLGMGQYCCRAKQSLKADRQAGSDSGGPVDGSPGGGDGPLAGQDVVGRRRGIGPIVCRRRSARHRHHRPPRRRHACGAAQRPAGGAGKAVSALHGEPGLKLGGLLRLSRRRGRTVWRDRWRWRTVEQRGVGQAGRFASVLCLPRRAGQALQSSGARSWQGFVRLRTESRGDVSLAPTAPGAAGPG